jgi:uncharacterized protein
MTINATVDEPTSGIVSFIRRDVAGRPILQGSRCRECQYIYVGERDNCARCCARDSMDAVELSQTGKLYAWTIVHRSFPGIPTPFIDVIVDLDDGAHLKGVLRGVAPDPDAIQSDLPVRVVFDDVVPPGQDRPFLAYSFVPA